MVFDLKTPYFSFCNPGNTRCNGNTPARLLPFDHALVFIGGHPTHQFAAPLVEHLF